MKTLAADSEDASIRSSSDKLVPLKIYIPDLFIQKSFQFRKDDLLWEIKQQIIDSLPKELNEHFNYGLFSPPVNGKAGKFLDEHRTLFEYPFSEPVGYLELRYKRRVYKIMNLDEKQIKQLHTRTNLRRMIDFVASGQHEKVGKMCARGMDPNFHCADSGETPLTVAVSLKQPAKVILALVNGGALLDFRTKDGFTAMHRAVQKNNLEALKILLDLGASPNYKDGRGLTPLYHSLLHASDPQLTETLLHDHAVIGTCDHQGWQEVHQACKYGLVQHLEHLLFYGADINARNASGNTPLHICAVNDQENCARVLLFRGADRDALNFANQSAYQVAVIAGNHVLGDLIKNHSENNIVLFRETPRYNPCRRSSIAPAASQLIRACSDPRLESLGSLGGRLSTFMMKPPSPCPSNSSLPPLSSSASCMSEASTSSSSTCCTQTSSSEETASASIVAESGVSDSSGVCTSNSGASFEEQQLREFESSLADMLEGQADCMKVGMPSFIGFDKMNPKLAMQRVEGRREMKPQHTDTLMSKWKMYGKPRTIILRKGKNGFGFVLRGAKATSPLMERAPSEFWPSLQYLEDVDSGGVADLAGLKKGDFVLEINGQDVSQAPHEDVVSIIRLSGDIVMMTVVTIPENVPEKRDTASNLRMCATLPRNMASKKAPVPPKRDPRTTLTVGRYKAQSMVAGLAELEILGGYDSEGHSAKSSSMESITNRKLQHGRSKFASIRARPSSQRISSFDLKNLFPPQQFVENLSGATWNSPKVYGSVAAMKRSKALRSKLSYFIGKIHKDFHSTPELRDPSSATLETKSHSHENFDSEKNSNYIWQNKTLLGATSEKNFGEKIKYRERAAHNIAPSPMRCSDVIYAQTLPLRPGKSLYRVSYPPPSHPPPPPPVSQVVEVNVTKAVSDYANVNVLNHDSKSNVMSSFRPGDSAKLYASPQNVVSIGYKQIVPKVEFSSKQNRAWESSEKKPYSVPAKLLDDSNAHKIAVSSKTCNNHDPKNEYTTFGKYSGKKVRDSSSSDGSHTLDRGTLRILKGKQSLSSGYESKFEGEDSDTSSVQNFIPFSSTSHVPFIPEPDYESNEEEDDFVALEADRSEIQLSTFSSGNVPVAKDKSLQCTVSEADSHCSDISSLSAHDEAKHAIQQARERLRFSQKPPDGNTTVVFISGRIENKAEKSEIQLHRNEEGRLTGTVVISTVKEPLESSYLTSGVKSGDMDSNNDLQQSGKSSPTASGENPIYTEATECVQDVLSVEGEETSVQIVCDSSVIQAASPIRNDNEEENIKDSDKKKVFCEEELPNHEQDTVSHSVKESCQADIPEPFSEYPVPQLSSDDPSETKNKNISLEKESDAGSDLVPTDDCISETQNNVVSAKSSCEMCQDDFSESDMLQDGKKFCNKCCRKQQTSECEKSSNNINVAAESGFVNSYSLDLVEIDGLVPPPPEFAEPQAIKEPFLLTLAPPPEFSDSYGILEPDLKATADSTRISVHGQPRKHLKCLSVQSSYFDGCSIEKRGKPRPHYVHERGSGYDGVKVQKRREHKEFRYKPLPQWTTHDILDWLDSLFLSEYKQHFAEAGITGAKLANMDSNDLMGLGVKQMGHRLNMERSVKRYLR